MFETFTDPRTANCYSAVVLIIRRLVIKVVMIDDVLFGNLLEMAY